MVSNASLGEMAPLVLEIWLAWGLEKNAENTPGQEQATCAWVGKQKMGRQEYISSWVSVSGGCEREGEGSAKAVKPENCSQLLPWCSDLGWFHKTAPI